MVIGGQQQIAKSAEYGFHLCSVYILDWSLTDFDEQVVNIRDDDPNGLPREERIIAFLRSLPTADYTEILTAIQEHEKRVEAELVKEKNDQGGRSVSLVNASSAA